MNCVQGVDPECKGTDLSPEDCEKRTVEKGNECEVKCHN